MYINNTKEFKASYVLLSFLKDKTGLSPVQLAHIANLSPVQIYKNLDGTRKTLKIETLLMIKHNLPQDYKYLIDEFVINYEELYIKYVVNAKTEEENKTEKEVNNASNG